MSQRRTAEQIVDAIAGGARGLFLNRSPSAVSIREIAAASGVNLGLIHRYVGTKDDVIALVLDRHTLAARALIEQTGDGDLLASVAGAAVHSPGSGRLVAGLILDGVDVAALKGHFPLLEGSAQRSEDIDVAMAYALALGWEVFGSTLLDSMNAESDPNEIASKLADAMSVIQRRA